MTVIPTKLNVDWSTLILDNPRTVSDGRNGIAIEKHMRSQGYPLNPNSTVDMPSIGATGVEIKSRGIHTDSPNTVGTMTIAAILATPWEQTSFVKKLQVQFRVMVGEHTDGHGIVVDSYVLDMRHPRIQEQFKDAYETARKNLALGKDGTSSGTKFGYLEIRDRSVAFRIPDSGMKLIEATIPNLKNALFEF